MRVALLPTEGEPRAVVIRCPRWTGTFPEFLEAAREAVTEWLDSPGDGQRARAEGRGVFTLADLAGYCPECFLKGTALGRLLAGRGIDMVSIEAAEPDPEAGLLGIGADTNLYQGREP